MDAPKRHRNAVAPAHVTSQLRLDGENRISWGLKEGHVASSAGVGLDDVFC